MPVCCPAGGLGPAPLSSITPKGKVVTLSPKSEASTRAPLLCYQVGPESPKRIICVFSDVYGIDSGTHKAYCDTLQERLGETTAVWMPDLFRGNTLFVESFLDKYLSFDAQVMMNAPRFIWAVKTRVTASAIDQDIMEIVQPAMKEAGCEKIGCSGFCFGGTVLCRAMGVEGGEFEAGVGNHAAFQPDELMAGGKGSPEELFKMTGNKPVLFLNAKQDKVSFSTSKLIQEGAERRGISPNDMAIEFPDMNHGFVTRGDPADPVMRENQEKAIDLAVKFFNDNLSV